MTTPPDTTQPRGQSLGVAMTARLDGLETTLTHGPSGAVLVTTPPRDNGGTGEAFSPTDLVGAALAACALTTMELVARREGLTFGPARASVEKRMQGPPRRIGALELVFDLPAQTPADQRARFEEIARTCPVALSLHPDVRVPMTFRWP